MNDDFRDRILKDYRKNLNWQKIFSILDIKIAVENVNKISFRRKNDLIFRVENYTTRNHAYQSRRLCIFFTIMKEIFDTIHDDDNEHLEFAKCYERISIS